ncbi:UTP10 [Candida theae]|uniref:U3 small nucleolar RNA-associated protein 10 n=1 Tax=Candida theae TaxID=1198502 RepID=A0AAD5BHE1_9ASCO|nr:UTP10 [Candida theae]KAI5963834.1 UTP10 [Candida theae]
MSSLASQLKSINEKTSSVALNRQQRSKLHSRSLIFEPKVAATQDYEYIHQISTDGLDELCDLDSRFAKFKTSLFATDSINFDRNVQTEDVIQQINTNINAFFTLLGPYYNFTAALTASEWLVRRFQANIHNAEHMVLSVLPYYQQPVFVKVLNVIPKQNIPKIFEWLGIFKEQLKPPTLQSIFRAFYSDGALFKFYTSFLNDSIKNGTVYKDQLVFYLSVTIQILASSSKNQERLNDYLIPAILETVDLLLSHQGTGSQVQNSDLKLTAFSVLSVISSIVSLNTKVINSLTVTICDDKECVSGTLIKPTLTLLVQLWNANKDFEVNHDTFIHFQLNSERLDILRDLKERKFKVDRFAACYFVSRFPAKESLQLLELIDLKNSEFSNTVISEVVNFIASNTVLEETARLLIVDIVKYIVKRAEAQFYAALVKKSLEIADIELRLQSTVADTAAEEEHIVVNEDDDVEEAQEEVEKFKYESVTVHADTYLSSRSDMEFKSVLKSLLTLCSLSKVSSQKSRILVFCHKVFKSAETALSFLLRTSYTPSVPPSIRINTLKAITSKVKESANNNTDFYLLVPLLLVGLSTEARGERMAISQIITTIASISREVHSGKKKVKTSLFMEDSIYTSAEEKKMISPQDALTLFNHVTEGSNLDDAVFDPSKLLQLVNSSFRVKHGKKSLGAVYKTFILSQWALGHLPVVFKRRIWKIASELNKLGGGDERLFFWNTDVQSYVQRRSEWQQQAREFGIENFVPIDESLVGLVGGKKISNETTARESEWLVKGLEPESQISEVVEARIKDVFDLFPTEAQLQIVNKLIELLVNDEYVPFDPMLSLQELQLSSAIFLQALENIQIGEKSPEQGVVKRRRRSSNSTKQAMAKDDVTSLAALHIRKLAILLEALETKFRKDDNFADPKLLKVLFNILTDLDYLGNDGNLPVLYTQELLASCMLLDITNLKNNKGDHKFDSNSIRADLIVNSIRNSSSPQVQNRLLLVISELAALAPEIILHSIMPIFTFMGAHTIRQDDEFSNNALQQTVAKVVPALAANSSESIGSEIEFLLTSFSAAFNHVPTHRRVKLFVALTQTLGCSDSMHIILFLLGQQFVELNQKKKLVESEAIVEFVEQYLKSFSAEEQLIGFVKFNQLVKQLPVKQLEPDSSDYDSLKVRPIYGSAIVGLTDVEFLRLRGSLFEYFDIILRLDSSRYDVLSLKSKIALVLLDSDDGMEKQQILDNFRELTSYILSELETFSNAIPNKQISSALYDILTNLFGLLPLVNFVDSIAEFLDIDKLSDTASIKVAKNYAVLSASKFEEEITFDAYTKIGESIIEKLLGVLIKGIGKNIDPELQQAYLNTFAVVTRKVGASNADFIVEDMSKFMLESLNVFTTDCGLLNSQSEVVVAAINAIISMVNIFGVKTLGIFPKIIPPSLKIWETTNESDNEGSRLVQESVLLLLSSYIKKMPAFMVTTLDSILLTTLASALTENSIKSAVLNLVINHMEAGLVLKSLCNIWFNKDFFKTDNAASIGLYLNTLESTIDKLEKKEATQQASLFFKLLIHAFEFREYSHLEGDKFDDNTIGRIESSFHSCAISIVMKLNDKSFRPLFANLVRWATTGEGSTLEIKLTSRLLSFYRFFNKLQDQLKSIVTSYYSYLIDTTSSILGDFASRAIKDTNLRRIVLISLTSSFNYDQDEYWSQEGRFESIANPLLNQLSNIEESIGKYLVKAISALVSDVTSNEYNERVLKSLIKYISYDNENTSNTKIWTVRALKTIFQKMGESWLPYLPRLVPHIAELLEDEDEHVELEVREGLVRVIEKILGEPLDKYLS